MSDISDTKRAATCPSCGCERDVRGEIYDPEQTHTLPRRCSDSFHSAHPVSAEGERVALLHDDGTWEWFDGGNYMGGMAVAEFVPKAAAEARAAELEEKLAATEKWGQEGWAWLDDALKALGVETVFDIPKHPQ